MSVTVLFADKILHQNRWTVRNRVAYGQNSKSETMNCPQQRHKRTKLSNRARKLSATAISAKTMHQN